MERGTSGAWDERFHAIFSAANVEELASLEHDVDAQRPWAWLDDPLHNPYLDAFEAIYGTRGGPGGTASTDGGDGTAAEVGSDAKATTGSGAAGWPTVDGNGVEADEHVTLGPDGLVDPRGELSLEDRARKFWMELRGRWVKRYSWAIPNREAVETVATHDPLVEIGAGTGYWAYLLEQAGADVVCYDPAQPGPDRERWHEVRRGGVEVLRNAPFDDRALFVCWPPFYETLAADALETYGGDAVIYVGEGPGGCNATRAFFEALEAGSWRLEREIRIPRWPGVEDSVRIYER